MENKIKTIIGGLFYIFLAIILTPLILPYLLIQHFSNNEEHGNYKIRQPDTRNIAYPLLFFLFLFIFPLASSLTISDDLSSGLVAYYQLDENYANTTVDDIAGTQDGTASTNTNNLYDATAKQGSSFDFSASEKVTLTNMLSGASGYTYCTWVQTNTLGSYKRVISKDNNAVSYNILLRMTNGNKFQGSVNVGTTDTYITGSTTITTGRWYSVCVTYDGSNLDLYVDGSSDATTVTSASGNLRTASDVITIGSYRDASGQWDGLIDDVGIWNRALNSTEIGWYNQSLPYEGGATDSITLNFPSDGYTSTTQSVDFNGTLTYINNVSNVSLWTNSTGTWQINQTNTSGLDTGDYIFPVTGINSGTFLWNYEVCLTNSTCQMLVSNRTLSIDLPPTIDLLSPIDNYQSTSLTQTFIGNFSDDVNLQSVSLFIYNVTPTYEGRMWVTDLQSGNVAVYNLDGTLNATYSGTGVASGNIVYDDHGSMWTANTLGRGVTKINITDGSMVNYTGTGIEPIGIAYDGQGSVWTANSVSDTVSKINITDGSIVNYTSGGDYPIHLAYDGNGVMWVNNHYSRIVTKINVSTGAVIESFAGTGVYNAEIVFDGVNMWTENYGSTSVTRVEQNGTLTNFTSILINSDAMGYDYNGAMWVAESSGTSVAKVNVSTGEITRYNGTDDHPFSSAYDDHGSMWIANLYYNDYILTKVNITDGSMTNISGAGSGISEPTAVAYDSKTLIQLFGINEFNITEISGTSNSGEFTFTFPDYGNYTWGMKICDINNNCVYSTNRTIILSETVDTSPMFYEPIPSSDSINYGNNFAGVDFNLTNNTDDGNGWQVNNTLFTINSSGYLTQNTDLLSGGSYSLLINVTDSANQSNTTVYTLTVNATTTSLSLTITNSTYPVVGTANASETNINDSDSTYNLYIDGILHGTGSDIDIENFTAGTYTIIYNTSGGTNYSSATVTKELLISQSSDSCSVNFNVESAIDYGESYLAYSNCTSANTLYINGTSMTNNTSPDVGVGTWNFTVVRTDTTNYSNTYDTKILTISEGTPILSLDITNSTYPNAGTINASESNSVDSDLTYNLYIDDVLHGSGSTVNIENYTVGTYTFVYNTSGGTNFSSASTTKQLLISKATPTLSLYFTNSSSSSTNSNLTVINGSNITVNATSNIVDSQILESNFNLSSNDNNIGNFQGFFINYTNSSMEEGLYPYQIQWLGNDNYTALNSTIYYINVSSATATPEPEEEESPSSGGGGSSTVPAETYTEDLTDDDIVPYSEDTQNQNSEITLLDQVKNVFNNEDSNGNQGNTISYILIFIGMMALLIVFIIGLIEVTRKK